MKTTSSRCVERRCSTRRSTTSGSSGSASAVRSDGERSDAARARHGGAGFVGAAGPDAGMAVRVTRTDDQQRRDIGMIVVPNAFGRNSILIFESDFRS